MKLLLIISTFLLSLPAYSQYSYHYDNENKEYFKARDLFDKDQFALAYPILNQLQNQVSEEKIASENYKIDIDYFFIVTALQLNKQFAVQKAIAFTEDIRNQERITSMNYYLGHYFFVNNEHEKAIKYFEKSAYNNLGNEQIASLKFELAYSYFYLKNYEMAKPLFDEIHQLPTNKYYLPSNYYFGFISYREKDYSTALLSFKIVESLPDYNGIVPYYIAEIYYFQNQPKEALFNALKALENPNIFYKNDLELLAGQLYFEQQQYQKAIPYFETYITSSEKVSKEILYETSYSYYRTKAYTKAIEGFKQLSNENDSLGQNSMYLLGDLYLKSNNKSSARNAFQFSANNSSNKKQQEISIYNYAKLSYELKYKDVALSEIKLFLSNYPSSEYQNDAKEILVNLLAGSDNFSEALSTYQSIKSPSPELQKVFPKILFGKASELLNEQKIIEAKEILQNITKDVNGGNIIPVANFWLGEIAYREQKFDDAINYIHKYLLNPQAQGEANLQSANYILGYCFLKKQLYKQSLESFRQVTNSLKYSSNNIEQDSYLRTGDNFFMLKDYIAAKAIYDKVISLGLSESDYALYQNSLIAGIHNPDEKVRELNTLEAKFPTSEYINDADFEIANTYMAEEKFKDAIVYLNKVIAHSSNEVKPKAYLKLGLAWYNLNDNNTALLNYQKLLTEYPNSLESDLALENIKSIYIERNKPEDYIAILKKAGKAITTTEADSISFNAASTLYNNGDCNNSISAFTNYIEHYPNGAFVTNANYFRSLCYFKNKDWKNALTGFEIVANSINNKYVETATLQTAKLYYLEMQQYEKAKSYFNKLSQIASTPDNQLEALRGLVRSYYQTKDYSEASRVAKELLSKKNISTDDRSIANLVLGKSLETSQEYENAIIAFKLVSNINKGIWGAEARYEIAYCYYSIDNLASSEKSALDVIKENGSSDFWTAKAYILLGDIYSRQKDYFNAKAAYQSVAVNATITELKTEAQQKLDKAIADEKAASKIIQ